MVRLTLRDAQQAVSFLVEEEVLRRMVAACSTNPSTLEGFLLAAEAYQGGITQRVFDELMEFDRVCAREGLSAVQRQIQAARQRGEQYPFAFEVVDEVTEEESRAARGTGLVLIDLTQKTIRTSPGLEMPVYAEIQLHDGTELTGESVTYRLAAEWKVGSLE